MQTEAEKFLIKIIKKILILSKNKLKLINLGAAKSTVIEDNLLKSGFSFSADRLDIEDCRVNKDYVKKTYLCSLENMAVVKDNSYDLAFANFVMEHIEKIENMALEVKRILKPGGNLIITLPNPQAPEFKLARITPTRFHQLFRKKGHDNAYPVNYAYQSIANFKKIMQENAWILQEEKYFAATYNYLHRFPVINIISYLYDKIISYFSLKSLLGHVTLHFSSKL